MMGLEREARERKWRKEGWGFGSIWVPNNSLQQINNKLCLKTNSKQVFEIIYYFKIKVN